MPASIRRAVSKLSMRSSQASQIDNPDVSNTSKTHSLRRQLSFASFRSWAKSKSKAEHPETGNNFSTPTLLLQHQQCSSEVGVETAELDGNAILHPLELATPTEPVELSGENEIPDEDLPLRVYQRALLRRRASSTASSRVDDTLALVNAENRKSQDTPSASVPEPTSRPSEPSIAESSNAPPRYRRRYAASTQSLHPGVERDTPFSARFQVRSCRQPVFRRPPVVRRLSVSSQAASCFSAPAILCYLDHSGHVEGFCGECGRPLNTILERDSEDDEPLPPKNEDFKTPRRYFRPPKAGGSELGQRFTMVNSREFATDRFFQHSKARRALRSSSSSISVADSSEHTVLDSWSGPSYQGTGSTELTVPSWCTGSSQSCPGRRSPGVTAPNCICTGEVCFETCPRCRPSWMMHSARGGRLGGRRSSSPPVFGPGPRPGQVVPTFGGPTMGNVRWKPLVAQREEWISWMKMGQRPGMSYEIAGEPVSRKHSRGTPGLGHSRESM